MSDGRIITPAEHIADMRGNGHASASQRRELALRQTLGMQTAVIDHLKAVLFFVLEQRKDEPLVIPSERLRAILLGGCSYTASQHPNGDIVYELPVQSPAAEPPPPEKAPT